MDEKTDLERQSEVLRTVLAEAEAAILDEKKALEAYHAACVRAEFLRIKERRAELALSAIALGRMSFDEVHADDAKADEGAMQGAEYAVTMRNVAK